MLREVKATTAAMLSSGNRDGDPNTSQAGAFALIAWQGWVAPS